MAQLVAPDSSACPFRNKSPDANAEVVEPERPGCRHVQPQLVDTTAHHYTAVYLAPQLLSPALLPLDDQPPQFKRKSIEASQQHESGRTE